MWPYCACWCLPLTLRLTGTGDTGLPIFYCFATADILGYSTGSSKHALPMKSFPSLTTELLRKQRKLLDQNFIFAQLSEVSNWWFFSAVDELDEFPCTSFEDKPWSLFRHIFIWNLRKTISNILCLKVGLIMICLFITTCKVCGREQKCCHFAFPSNGLWGRKRMTATMSGYC